MVKNITTKPVTIGSEKIFMQKAENFLTGATRELANQNPDAATVLAVHAVISSCDAMCAKFLKQKHSGMDHLSAIDLLKTLPLDKTELDTKASQARQVLGLKTLAEYTDILIKQANAALAVQQAERIFNWAKQK